MAAAKITTKQLAVLSVSTAVQIVLLLISFILPTVKISLLFVVSIFNGLLCSAGYRKSYVFLSFTSVSVLSLIFISNYIIPVSYILFFGAYGIIHFLSISKKPFLKQILRFAYLTAGLGLLYLIFTTLLSDSIILSVPYVYFVPAVIVVGYLLFQFLFDMVIKEFYKHTYLSDLIIE